MSSQFLIWVISQSIWLDNKSINIDWWHTLLLIIKKSLKSISIFSIVNSLFVCRSKRGVNLLKHLFGLWVAVLVWVQHDGDLVIELLHILLGPLLHAFDKEIEWSQKELVGKVHLVVRSNSLTLNVLPLGLIQVLNGLSFGILIQFLLLLLQEFLLLLLVMEVLLLLLLTLLCLDLVEEPPLSLSLLSPESGLFLHGLSFLHFIGNSSALGTSVVINTELLLVLVLSNGANGKDMTHKAAPVVNLRREYAPDDLKSLVVVNPEAIIKVFNALYAPARVVHV